MWTVESLAQYLAVSNQTIYRLLEAGKLPGAFQVSGVVGSVWRIPESAVAEYMRAVSLGKKK